MPIGEIKVPQEELFLCATFQKIMRHWIVVRQLFLWRNNFHRPAIVRVFDVHFLKNQFNYEEFFLTIVQSLYMARIAKIFWHESQKFFRKSIKNIRTVDRIFV
jgi:hypothetical protein